MASRVTPALLCAGALLSICIAGVRAQADPLVIADVHVVDVRAGVVMRAMDVEVQGNRIVGLHETHASVPSGAKIFDGRGGYLVPGFWDMHTHVNHPQFAEQWMLPLLVAAGVTGVRDMAGDCWQAQCPDSIGFMRMLQARLASGEIIGPRILAIGSAAVDGPRELPSDMQLRWVAPGNAGQARDLVRELKRRGVDFIKPYDTLPPEAYFELVREARELNLPVSGHVPMSVSTLDALRAGQISIEHAKHPLLDCSRYSRTFHQVFADWANGRSPHIYRNWVDLARGDASAGGYYEPILADYDEKLCQQVIEGMARSGAYYVPTLITRRFEARADEESFLQDPRLPLVPQGLLAAWHQDAAAYQARFAASPEEKSAYLRFYELALQIVGKAYAAGVPILVGTDAPDSYCFPGSAFHDELRELRAAGLSNAAILRAATLGAAEFLGRSTDFGTVERGKIADLVVLTANPLEDIAHASRISAVVLNGRLLDSAVLRQLQSRAAAFAAADASPDTAD